jgi:dihydropyrimidinase
MTSPSLLIRGGQIVDAAGLARRDLLIQGETIVAAGDLSGVRADRVVDADGLWLLPGGVDTHVHFNDEFMGTVSVHDYEKGTRAAAFGGTTTIIDFSNQRPGQSLQKALDDKMNEARTALVDWGVHPVITRADDRTLDEIPALIRQGVPTFKCYMTYRDEGIMTEAPDLRRILIRLRETGGMLLVHAEDNDMAEANISRLISEGRTAPIFHARSKPTSCEDAAIERAVQIAEETGGRLFVVHLASAAGLDIITRARGRGVGVAAETCTHYLAFSEACLEGEDGLKFICSPPLRPASVQEALWRGVEDGRIAQVSSDDAAFSWGAKLLGRDRFDRCPNGLPGVELRLPLLFTLGVAAGRITPGRFVELVSTNPAKIFGLYPRKGCLESGSDADILLWDPAAKWTLTASNHHMATDWSPVEGMEMTGRVKKVYSRGELIIDGDGCPAEPGRGRFVFRRLPS